MKKIGILCLIGTLIAGLFGCARPLSIGEEEALSVLTELVPLSYEINDLFFGNGLPAADPPEERPGTVSYRPVRDDCSYRSTDEMKAAAAKVYSARYLESVFVTVFSGNENDAQAGELGLDMSTSPRYREIDGRLTVDVSYQPLAIRGRLTVVSVTLGRATPQYVATETVCRNEAGETETLRILLTKNPDGAWRLDSPTY